MAAISKEKIVDLIQRLPENELLEVFDFIAYLHWRREERDQSWFQTEDWQARYQEAQRDLAEGRYRDFEDINQLLDDLKS